MPVAAFLVVSSLFVYLHKSPSSFALTLTPLNLVFIQDQICLHLKAVIFICKTLALSY